MRGEFEQEPVVPFAKAHIKDIVDYMLPSRYWLKLPCSSYIRYVRFYRLMTSEAEGLPLLKAPSESRESRKQLGVSLLDRKLLPTTQANFTVLLIEAARFYINNPTVFTAFRAPSLYRFGK